jgi:hypothetical protein
MKLLPRYVNVESEEDDERKGLLVVVFLVKYRSLASLHF